MKIKVGVSARHIHLNNADFKLLFGDIDIDDYKRNNLSQPNEYATNLYVTVKGTKGEINNVCLLGPLRDYTQVEISKTDCYKLGITAPVRESGDLSLAAEVTILFKENVLTKKCAIIATRHIHISQEEAKNNNLFNQKYKIKIDNIKGGTLDNVYLKVEEQANLELHLDLDDANANLLNNGDEVTLIERNVEYYKENGEIKELEIVDKSEME